MNKSKATLLAGPAFFVLWFVGGTSLWSATGGEAQADRAEFAATLLSNESSAYAGATLLVLAAALLLLFAAGIWATTQSVNGIGLVPVLGIAAVAILLVLQAGLAIEAVALAEEAPDVSWTVYQLSGGVGFESFMTALLGAVALGGFAAATDKSKVRGWFWWLTAVFAAVLAVGGVLEGLGIVPNGRLATVFGIWIFVAGFSLSFAPPPEQETNK